jgi:peptidoglycan/LPS O-acetylase OafA/YrhL
MNAIIATSQQRNTALDKLRAFIVVLVVAHHAVLAYHPYAPAPAAFSGENLFWAAFPIVDTQRWSGIDVFVGFNDTFFMSLLFFLSGIFVPQGFRQKGIGGFLRDRVMRLGLPFLAAAALVAPLAYYPAWLQRGGVGGIAAYAQAWLSLGAWPAGPAWFLWVLLAFDALAAVAQKFSPRWAEVLGERIGAFTPGVFFAFLVAVGIVVFVPLALLVDPSVWSHAGPFFVQTCRILLYASFFTVGIAVGAHGIGRGLLAADGLLARRWLLWPQVALGAYAALIVVYIMLIVAGSNKQPTDALEIATLTAFVVSCVASCFAFLSVFLQFGQREGKIFASLSRNSFGIYIVHYAFVVWLQFALLGMAWPGAAKGIAVFVGALVLSWVTAAAMRRVFAVRGSNVKVAVRRSA